MTPFMSAPRERFTRVIEQGPSYIRPLFVAARDAGIGLAIVPQGTEQFRIPTERPTVLFVGDDMHVSMGPKGFHQPSVRRFIRRCSAAVIVSCAPPIEAYAAAATSAVLGQDVILVETRPEHEEAWRSLIVGLKPQISMLIATIQPAGGVH